MWTSKCYEQIDRQMGYGSMFSASLQKAAYMHQAVLDEIADVDIPAGFTIGETKAYLKSLGYSDLQVRDAVRYQGELLEVDEDGLPINDIDGEFDELIVTESGFNIQALLERTRRVETALAEALEVLELTDEATES